MPYLVGRVYRTYTVCALDCSDLVSYDAIDTGNRNAVIRGNEAIARIHQDGLRHRCTPQERGDGRGADFRLIISAEGRFGHGGGDDGITEEMDISVHR